MKFKKKRILVDAYRFDASVIPWPNIIVPWTKESNEKTKVKIRTRTKKSDVVGYIQVARSKLFVASGDWIVTSDLGNVFVMPNDAFERDYEPAEPS